MTNNISCESCGNEPQSRIPVQRFIDKLDLYLRHDDMAGARECIQFWQNEARRLEDRRGLLAVLNEAVGFYRRTQEKQPALDALHKCVRLVEQLGLQSTLSGATIFINAATTLSAFGLEEEGLPLYDKAAACYEQSGKTDTYEYAALLNNRASALNALRRYDEAEQGWRQAIAILQREGRHDGDIAISMVCLAHLTFDRDDSAYQQVEALLDEAWEYINSPRQARDGNYAYMLQKCAPSFEYFQRPDEAQALRDVAKEIYSQP